MKKNLTLLMAVVCLAISGGKAGANLLNPPENGLLAARQNPLFAAFIATNNSVYNSGDGVLSVSNIGFANTNFNAYQASTNSPGTQGTNNGKFYGQFYIGATIQSNTVDGQWEVTGGSLEVIGSLMGGTSMSILLTATLATGLNSLGYSTNGTELDFLFTVTGGNPAISSDFLENSKTNVQGSIYVNLAQPYTGFVQRFAIGGTATAFVPQTPQPQGAQDSEGKFLLNLPTVASQNYTIQQTTNCLNPDWVNVTNFLGTGSPFQLAVPTTNGPQYFYRVRQP